MNSPFRVRPGSRPGFRLAPAPGLPAAPVSSPLFRSGVQKYTFFPNRQTFQEKFFEKFFFSPRLPPPLALPLLPRSRRTGPQKYCFFPFRQTFPKEFFVNHRRKRLNSLSSTSKKNPRPAAVPTRQGPGTPSPARKSDATRCRPPEPEGNTAETRRSKDKTEGNGPLNGKADGCGLRRAGVPPRNAASPAASLHTSAQAVSL